MINGPKWNVDSYGLMYVTRRSIRTNGRQTRISGWSNWRESIENAIGRRLRPNWVYDYIVFYHDFLVVYSSIFYVDFIDESIGVSLYETLSRKDGLSILQEVMILSCSIFAFRFKWFSFKTGTGVTKKLASSSRWPKNIALDISCHIITVSCIDISLRLSRL